MRNEKDTMGVIQVPNDAYYGAQTQRAIENFPISGITISKSMIRALGIIKRSAAIVNHELGILDEIIQAQPTDGLWDDGRTDVGQLGLTYKEVEDAMNNNNSPHHKKYLEIRELNLHKMQPIPVCKIPK